MTQPQLAQDFSHMLARMPQWLRHDLNVKDEKVRARAEETMAAMIAAAVQTHAAQIRA